MARSRLSRYRAKRNFTRTDEPSGGTPHAPACGQLALRRAKACGAKASLRPSPGARRHVPLLGRDQGTVPRSGRSKAGRRGRGSSARVRRLRGHDTEGRIRRRHGPALGSRLLGAIARHVGTEGAQGRPFEVPARRRAPERRMGARSHEARPERRHAQQLAADQASGQVRTRRQRRAAPQGSLRRIRSPDGGHRGRSRRQAASFHGRRPAAQAPRRKGHTRAGDRSPGERPPLACPRSSSRRSWHGSSRMRRRIRAGGTRSSSTVTACRCASSTGRPRFARARGSTGPNDSPRSRESAGNCPIAWSTARSLHWTNAECRVFRLCRRRWSRKTRASSSISSSICCTSTAATVAPSHLKPARSACRNCCRRGRWRRACATSSISRQRPTPSSSRPAGCRSKVSSPSVSMRPTVPAAVTPGSRPSAAPGTKW